MITLFALAGSLVDLSTQANNITLYGSSLPITDSETLFFAAAGNSILCLELAQAGSSHRQRPRWRHCCTDTCSSPRQRIHTYFHSCNPNSHSHRPNSHAHQHRRLPHPRPRPPRHLARRIRFHQHGLLSSLPTQRLPRRRTKRHQRHLRVRLTNPPVAAADLAEYMCQPASDSGPFGPLCTSFCANRCANWGAKTLINGLGSSFVVFEIGVCG
jgi:hypothetical protein